MAGPRTEACGCDRWRCGSCRRQWKCDIAARACTVGRIRAETECGERVAQANRITDLGTRKIVENTEAPSNHRLPVLHVAELISYTDARCDTTVAGFIDWRSRGRES